MAITAGLPGANGANFLGPERRYLPYVHLGGLPGMDKLSSGGGIRPEVLAEAMNLHGYGIDIGISDTPMQFDGPDDLQSSVYEAVSVLEREHPEEGLSERLFDPKIHPIGATWLRLSKRAIALNPLYRPSISRLGEGVEPEVFFEPMFRGGRSAAGILFEEKSNEQALRIISNYFTFIETEMHGDGSDEFGLTSADYLANVPDARAVRYRAAVASDVIRSYALSKDEFVTQGKGLNITSLGCGAAGPMFTIVPMLKEAGVNIGGIRLVDWDVMALASAASLADDAGIQDLVSLRRHNILRGDLSRDLKDADVVDMLGLFEYFPEKAGNERVSYDLARNFLRDVGRNMKPGGLIVFGNMLNERSHQRMFSQVWPKLEQRSVTQVLNLIHEAGFPMDAVSVRIPTDGVYAIYSIKVPEAGLRLPHESIAQNIARRLVFRTFKEY